MGITLKKKKPLYEVCDGQNKLAHEIYNTEVDL